MLEISSGKLDLTQADVIGWVDAGTQHPRCYSSSGGFDYACHQNLASKAVQLADPFVDFSAFDTDGDGRISPSELSVVIIVAGYEAASGCETLFQNLIWAHRGVIQNPPSVDGKVVADYAMFGELHCFGGQPYRATIGVMVHELMHLSFGIPDLYDTDGSSDGIGFLGVMGAGSWTYLNGEKPGETPVFPTAWTMEYLNLVTPEVYEPNISAKGIPLYPLSDQRRNVIRINTPDPNEYFLIAHRRPLQGTFDQGLELLGVTGGVAVWHIDLSSWPGCKDTNTCNSNESRKMVDLEEADGSQDLDVAGGLEPTQSDLFDTTKNTFGPDTNPSSDLYTGQRSGVLVIVAGYDTSSVSFLLDINPSPPNISVDPLSLDFGSVSVGGSRSLVVTVRNTGGSPLTIDSIQVSGDPFFVDSSASTCQNGTSVPQNSSCSLTVVFRPTSSGSFYGTLNVQSNDPDSPFVFIELKGSGVSQGSGGGGCALSGGGGVFLWLLLFLSLRKLMSAYRLHKRFL